MPGSSIGFTIRCNIRRQFREGPKTHCNEDWITQSADARKCICDRCGYADRRMRLLIRLRDQLDAVKAVIFTVVGEAGFSPCLLNDFQDLAKTLTALAIRHAVGFVGSGKAAAANAEDQAAMADMIDGRRLLGHPQWVT